jgi:aspartate/glutamate racemase
MKNNLYANALISHNIETICPNDLEQKIVMSVINSIKSGNIAFDQHFLLKPIIDSFKNQDVQKILL